MLFCMYCVYVKVSLNCKCFAEKSENVIIPVVQKYVIAILHIAPSQYLSFFIFAQMLQML